MRVLIALLLLACSASAAAINCANAITTLDINECASREQAKVEAKLNKVYQRVLKSLDKPDEELEKYSEMKKKLIVAQRAWVKFREADCAAVYAKSASGTMRTGLFIGCMQSHAEQRIKTLEAYEDQ